MYVHSYMAENFENDDLQNTFVVLEVRKKKKKSLHNYNLSLYHTLGEN